MFERSLKSALIVLFSTGSFCVFSQAGSDGCDFAAMSGISPARASAARPSTDRAPLASVAPSMRELTSWRREITQASAAAGRKSNEQKNPDAAQSAWDIAAEAALRQSNPELIDLMQLPPGYTPRQFGTEFGNLRRRLMALKNLMEAQEKVLEKQAYLATQDAYSRPSINLDTEHPLQFEVYGLNNGAPIDAARRNLFQLKQLSHDPNVPSAFRKLMSKAVYDFETVGWFPSHTIHFVLSEFGKI